MWRAFRDAFVEAWHQARPPLVQLATEAEIDQMERILDRCEAQRRAIVGFDPAVVDRWITFLEHHDMVLIVGRPNQAVAMSTPPRVH